MTVRQHSFYLEDDDWVALRHYCLDRGLSVSAFMAQAARDAIAGSVPTVPSVPSVPVAPRADVVSKTVIQPAPPRTNEIVGSVRTGSGVPAAIPYNPVRAVPKPDSKKKATRTRVGA